VVRSYENRGGLTTERAIVQEIPQLEKNEGWYVAKVKPNLERRIEDDLAADGVSTFVPRMLRRERYMRGSREAVRPIIPGYVFVGFDGSPEIQAMISNARGEKRCEVLHSSMDIPLRIPDEVMIRFVGDVVIKPLPERLLEKGDFAQLLEGPFAGFIGEVMRVDKRFADILLAVMNMPIKTPLVKLLKVCNA
jgi:transcriptional antiterminator RfaH